MISAIFGDRIIFIERGELLETSDELPGPSRKALRVAMRREYVTEAPDPTEEAEPGPDGELIIGEGFRVLPKESDEHAIAASMAAGASGAFVI